eukprot:Amastigsp_a4735_53.p2 type:complete len:217 gc:universal Amastigsp_a4735_53:742-92(-)
MLGQRRRWVDNDRPQQLFHRLALERVREGAHSEEQNPERPDVVRGRVPLIARQLGRHVVGSADASLAQRRPMVENRRESKVRQLDVVLRVEQNVCRLQIAVEHHAMVAVRKPGRDLTEPLHHLRLGEVVAERTLVLHSGVQIAVRRVLENDDERVAVNKRVFLPDDVRVVERREHANLGNRVLHMLHRKVHHVDLLEDHGGSIRAPPRERHDTRRP